MNNRIIKFRAYHPKLEQMIEVYEIGWHYKKQPPHITTNKGWIAMNKNIILLQFTGIHDKNGKEIFEGDVVQSPFEEPEFFEIQWNSGGFILCDLDKPNNVISLHMVDYYLTVVGNIYENPELLKSNG